MAVDSRASQQAKSKRQAPGVGSHYLDRPAPSTTYSVVVAGPQTQSLSPRTGSDVETVDAMLAGRRDARFIICIIWISGEGRADTQAGPEWLEEREE